MGLGMRGNILMRGRSLLYIVCSWLECILFVVGNVDDIEMMGVCKGKRVK